MCKTLTQALLAAFCAILATAPLEGGGVMLINMRNAMLAGEPSGTPLAMCNAPSGILGFLVPWAPYADSGFKIEFGIYIPQTSSPNDGDCGILLASNQSSHSAYRIFTLSDDKNTILGLFIDTDTTDAGRRTGWLSAWWPETNLGYWLGHACHISYNNSDRKATFEYDDQKYTNSRTQGSRSAIYPDKVYLLNGTSGAYAHGLLYCRYISGQGAVIRDYIPVKSGNTVKLKDTISGTEYLPTTPSYYTYEEIPA